MSQSIFRGTNRKRFASAACRCLKNALLIPAALVATSWLLLPPTLPAQTSVVTWHYNNGRNSVNTTETVLTPSNVNVRGFGKLYTRPLDGLVVGHPLYLPGLSIPGNGVHNVVFVATMEDSVYAFDADNPTLPPLWVASLLAYSPAGATPVPDKFKGCQVTTDWTNVGVISTPVIDPASNTIYLVAETYENKKAVHRLHALDVTTGQEKLGGPATITATYTLNGVTNTFVDTHQMNRPGLLLVNGNIYIGFGGASCNGGDSGWIMSYNATTLAQTGTLDIEAGEYFASIWQKGAGLSADSSGNVYAETGEGPVSGPGTPGQDLGLSVFKVSQTGNTLAVADWFTPYNWSYLYENDLDLNNAVLVLPDQPGPYADEAIGVGKEGTIYLLNRDNMGQLCASCTTSDTQIIQELPAAAGKATGTPLVWNGSVYFTGGHVVSAFPLNNGQLVTPPVQSDSFAAGGHPLLTANGSTNAILWGGSGGILWAMDPTTMQVLWTTAMAPQRRDVLPVTAHFATPIVADGKLFIGALKALLAYGLLPVLAPGGGNNQTAAVATALPIPLSIETVSPLTGQGASGITVSFSDGNKGGQFSTVSGISDGAGMVSTIYTLPAKSGTYTVTASSTGYAPAAFTETAAPTAASKMIRAAGSGQIVPVATTVPKPLVAKVSDQNGNGIPGVAVTFNDGGKGGTLSASQVTTDSNGLAAVTYTTGTKAGKVTIQASSVGLPVLNIFVTVTPGPAANVTTTSGNNQTGTSSTALPNALAVKVTDQYGNLITGVPVSFSDGGARGSFSANPVTTAKTGIASVIYTTPPATGPVMVSATVTGVSAAANFNITVH